jgi:phospholipid-transporting ATPase
LLFVEENDCFSADLVMLGSAIENGACYIETSSLDGEKNLKVKSAMAQTQQFFKNFKEIEPIKLAIEANPPNQSLYDFEGAISIEETKLLVNIRQLVLRGAFLRNTRWIIGVAVYTGQDTKIMRNASPGRVKQSQIESTMNRLILSIMGFQACLCLLSAILNSNWSSNNALNHWYL